jgi:uncharacterized protein (TIGR03437 family)
VGLKTLRSSAAIAALLSSAAILSAAPTLRLVKSTVGPVSIAQGANGATQTVEAFNAGDGALSLSFSSSVPWVGATAGAQRACSSGSGTCTPLQFALSTSSLPLGIATGIVTVTDPNAVDAPQTITVSVQIGGSVPSTVNVFVAPGGTNDVSFSTNSQINGRVNTNSGGQWLSLTLDGSGSFLFAYPYRIHFTAAPDMALGTYTGSVTTSGSTFAPDNKNIPATMQVTNQPIAQASTDRVRARLAQGAAPTAINVFLNNLGQGSLTVSGATATAAAGGTWLTAKSFAGGAQLAFDPGTLAPGTYSGSVAIASNAANGTITVPVDFTVVPKGPPLVYYQGVVDNGTFGAGDPVARGDVVAVRGEQLSAAALTVGQVPMATQIGGAKILVNGTPAPMYYSSYGQLAFQMPYEAPVGTALVQVQTDGQSSNTVSVPVVDRAPRMLLIGVGTYGAIVNQDGSIPMPVGSFPGVNTHPAAVGDTLTIYAIGLGATSPAVATGQPAPSSEPLARLTETPTINIGGGIGGTLVTPIFAGLTPTFAGLYQLNVTIPDNVPKGIVNLSLVFSDAVSNSVQIAIQ